MFSTLCRYEVTASHELRELSLHVKLRQRASEGEIDARVHERLFDECGATQL
jgi:hypothetical protein